MKNEMLYHPQIGNPLASEKEYYQLVWGKMKKKLADYLKNIENIPQDNYLTDTAPIGG